MLAGICWWRCPGLGCIEVCRRSSEHFLSLLPIDLVLSFLLRHSFSHASVVAYEHTASKMKFLSRDANATMLKWLRIISQMLPTPNSKLRALTFKLPPPSSELPLAASKHGSQLQPTISQLHTPISQFQPPCSELRTPNSQLRPPTSHEHNAPETTDCDLAAVRALKSWPFRHDSSELNCYKVRYDG